MIIENIFNMINLVDRCNNNCRFSEFLNIIKRSNHSNYKPSKFIIGAGGILIDIISNKLLLVKGPTKWSLPKGHLEIGETYNQCAMREIKEETNIDIMINRYDTYVRINNYIYYVKYVCDSYLLDIHPNDINEISDIGWFSLDDIKKMNCNYHLNKIINNWDKIMVYVNSNK